MKYTMMRYETFDEAFCDEAAFDEMYNEGSRDGYNPNRYDALRVRTSTDVMRSLSILAVHQTDERERLTKEYESLKAEEEKARKQELVDAGWTLEATKERRKEWNIWAKTTKNITNRALADKQSQLGWTHRQLKSAIESHKL